MTFGAADIQVDALVQYGCFGLLAALVFWSIWKGIPTVLAMHREVVVGIATSHKEAMTDLVKTFEKESEQCRDERIQVARDSAAEREKDRSLRHELNNTLTRVVAQLEAKAT